MSKKEIRRNFLTAQFHRYAAFSLLSREKIEILLRRILVRTPGLLKMFILFIDYLKKTEFIVYWLSCNNWKKWTRAVFVADIDRVVYNLTEELRFGDQGNHEALKNEMRETVEMILRQMSWQDRQIWQLYRSGFQADEIAVLIVKSVDSVRQRIEVIRRELLRKLGD